MRVDEFLKFRGRLKGVRGKRLGMRLEEVKGLCGLSDVGRKIIGHLSKGFRQRVGLAQAIIHNPPVLVLDEPTIGLDPHQIIEIRALIKELAGAHTVVLSTHILPEVAQVCEKVVIINAGRVVMEDLLTNLTQGQTLEDVFLRAIAQEEPPGGEPHRSEPSHGVEEADL